MKLVPVDPFTITDEAIRALPDEFTMEVSMRHYRNCLSFSEAREKARGLSRFVDRMTAFGFTVCITEDFVSRCAVYQCSRPPSRRGNALTDGAIDV